MDDVLPTDRPAASDNGLPGRRFDDVPRLQTEGGDLLRGAGGGPAAGSGEDEGYAGALARAVAVRFPDLSDKHGREKVEALIDHITETAIVRGELEEARLAGYTDLLGSEAELARIATGVTRNKAAIDEAKRQARPDLAQRIDAARWLIARCTEQINRMGGTEYDAASRAYTLLSGS